MSKPVITRHLRPVQLAMGLALGCTSVSAGAVETSPQQEEERANVPTVQRGAAHAHPSKRAQKDAHSRADDGPKIVKNAEKEVTEKWTVQGSSMNTLHASVGLSRMPQDVLHTPQTIDVVPQIVMKEQNVKSLDEALRNVPGITASIGEGEGGMAGDQFLIRGFAAQNDIYENGLRDFGVYARDSFNYDHIAVIKGPSSQVFGNGTTGGAINITTKTPFDHDHYSASFTGGSGSYYRGTLDFNKKISDTIAVRITGMGNENNVVGRDHVYSHRWGIAPSVKFGIGKPLSYVIEYFHQTDNRIPDYGVPVVQKPGASYSRPVTQYGVKRSNWYGTTFDQDVSNVDMLAGHMKWDINEHITLYNDTRGGLYRRYFSASQAGCGTACTAALFSGNASAAEVSRIGSLGGPNPYQQNDWSIQNVLSSVANFDTGGIRHQMVGGFDVEHIYDRRQNYAYNNPALRQYTNLLNPTPYVAGLDTAIGSVYPNNLSNIPNGVGKKEWKTSDATDVGVFLSDQAWLTSWFSVKAGVRWDNWNSHYSATEGVASVADTRLSQNQNTLNPSVSLMYTPKDNMMFYFNWAQSTTPTGLYVTNSSAPLTPKNANFSPEKSRLYEVGAKYSAFNDRVGLTASLFRLEKANSLLTDAVSGTVSSSGDSQRNQGLELSISGQLARNWNLIATYAYYDGVTTSGTAADIGKQIQYVPKNQATLWSVYEITPDTPYNISVGGGVTWRQAVFLNAANTARAPANLDFDAVISHRFDHHWSIALNGYNLANRLNYGNLFSNRVTPAAGRTFLFSLSMDY